MKGDSNVSGPEATSTGEFGRMTETSLSEEILNRHRSSWLDVRMKVDLAIVHRL